MYNYSILGCESFATKHTSMRSWSLWILSCLHSRFLLWKCFGQIHTEGAFYCRYSTTAGGQKNFLFKKKPYKSPLIVPHTFCLQRPRAAQELHSDQQLNLKNTFFLQKNNPYKSPLIVANIFYLQRQRAAHALRSDQQLIFSRGWGRCLKVTLQTCVP